ncbi:MAG: amidohydrolase family protein [Thermoplasmatales archaeon]
MEVFRGNFFVNGEFGERYVTVENGVIKSVSLDREGNDVTPIPGYILPGGVDMHVHFRDPGEEYKEDFVTGSVAAVIGGTTTVFDMPNNKIPVDNSQTFENKRLAILGRSYADFGLYQLASGTIVDSAIGEKIFLGRSTGGLVTELDRCVWSQKVKVVHAELQECLDKNKSKPTSLVEHDVARPIECEIGGIELIANFLERNVHIAHVTATRSLYLARHLGFSTEVTPHHLLLNNGMNLGAFGKVNPPLRKRAVQEELLGSIGSGLIDVISSDHAPHTSEEKLDFGESPSGIPGVETRVPLALSLYRKGIIPSLNLLVSLLMEKPAKLCRVNKGYIAPGYDADFISINFEKTERIRGEDLHSKSAWTPFEGYEAIFPNQVYLRGELIVQEGEIVNSRKGVFLDGKTK